MLNRKIALVTGASRGIGREIALTLAGYGATVVVNYNGSKEKAQEVVQEIKDNGGNAIALQASVSKSEEVEAMIKEVMEQFGRIDILVNNAGITKDNLVMKMSNEDFDAVIDTNLKGTFYCMKQVYRIMLKQKSGRIINISSVTGVMGNAGQVNYAASKAGVIGMTKSLARELASRGITVNAVAPGFIETEMTEVLSDKVKEAVEGQIPLKRMGQVKDVAEAVAFLASDKASYITGQVLHVDGGMAM
ncbi:MAG: 3-oxoacyl-[acyl-carrier-protein] reductase [Firmicutes bacterium]|uniref:3-oxoacyl-[acyl-carrier-protein] reductase n=1 Tax=Candidatus Scybalomonas excrementavium TaxID=2840943 RepID=A0A9D9I219_9FIRM|nr:3-oxoacyl-[acyl-carrier-protein] reductase [Candidatus Scybalomonas excrementavium]